MVSELKGKSVVFTGKMDRTRAEMEDIARANDMHPQGAVNRSTDILVTGARVGRTKTDKAKSLGVEIITEAEFMNAIMNGADPAPKAEKEPPTPAIDYGELEQEEGFGAW